jgi:hypothetical protein
MVRLRHKRRIAVRVTASNPSVAEVTDHAF